MREERIRGRRWIDTSYYVSVQFSLVAQSCPRCHVFAIPRTTAHQAFLSIASSWSLLKLMSSESVMSSNRLILCCPILLLPSTFPSIRAFSNESVLHIRWPKYWSFSFSKLCIKYIILYNTMYKIDKQKIY